MKESLPQVPGKHILACCDCVVHSKLQVGAQLIKNSMTDFTFIFPCGGGGVEQANVLKGTQDSTSRDSDFFPVSLGFPRIFGSLAFRPQGSLAL